MSELKLSPLSREILGYPEVKSAGKRPFGSKVARATEAALLILLPYHAINTPTTIVESAPLQANCSGRLLFLPQARVEDFVVAPLTIGRVKIYYNSKADYSDRTKLTLLKTISGEGDHAYTDVSATCNDGSSLKVGLEYEETFAEPEKPRPIHSQPVAGYLNVVHTPKPLTQLAYLEKRFKNNPLEIMHKSDYEVFKLNELKPVYKWPINFPSFRNSKSAEAKKAVEDKIKQLKDEQTKIKSAEAALSAVSIARQKLAALKIQGCTDQSGIEKCVDIVLQNQNAWIDAYDKLSKNHIDSNNNLHAVNAALENAQCGNLTTAQCVEKAVNENSTYKKQNEQVKALISTGALTVTVTGELTTTARSVTPGSTPPKPETPSKTANGSSVSEESFWQTLQRWDRQFVKPLNPACWFTDNC